MPLISGKNKVLIMATILLVGSFLFSVNAKKANAWGDYLKASNGTLTASDWNNLPNDFLSKTGAAAITGPLGINTTTPPAAGLKVIGPIVATSFSGTMNARNISSGIFGADAGNGDFFFNGSIGVSTTTATYALNVGGDINMSGTLRVNGTPFSSSQWLTNGSSIYYNVGNVGIGTTAPTARLKVSGGDLEMDNNTSIKINSAGVDTTLLFGNYGDGQGFGYGTTTTRVINLAVEGDVKSNRLCIREDCKAAWSDIVSAGGGGQWAGVGNDIYNVNTGNVGIGMTNPNNKLQVLGLINFNNVDKNTSVGKDAGLNLVAGASENTFFGFEAGKSGATGGTTAARFNTAIGWSAFISNTTGAQNTAVGDDALRSNTTGSWNTSVGDQALASNTEGYSNAAIGSYALRANTTGNNNFAIGTASLRWNTTGSSNAAIGSFSLHDNTSGNWNTAIGANALYKNSTGTDNIAIGSDAMYYNTIGRSNTAIGSLALTSNTLGSGNVANGRNALYDNTIGWENVAIGADALSFNTTGSGNTALGASALLDLNITNDTYSNNTAIGYNTGGGITTGINNTIIGANVIGLAGTTSNNIIIADGAGNRRINIDANGNIGIGLTNPTAKLNIVPGATPGIINTGSTQFSLLGSSGNVLVMADNTGTLYSANNPVGSVLLPTGTNGQTLRNSGGANWVADSNLFNNGTNVGIGATTTYAKLEIAGALKFGDTTDVCDANHAGAVKFNSTSKQSYICDGKRWLNQKNCGLMTDDAGQVYGTVQIGGQCWQAENMNVGTMLASGVTEPNNADNIIEKWCNASDPAQCALLGAYYNWGEAMRGSEVPGARGICPVGWHIPTDGEFVTLEKTVVGVIASPNAQYVCDFSAVPNSYQRCADNNGSDSGGTYGAGKSLRPVGIYSGDDLVGFNATYAGDRTSAGTNAFVGSGFTMWTSNPSGGSNAIFRFINGSYTTIRRLGYSRAYGFSVRCLKN